MECASSFVDMNEDEEEEVVFGKINCRLEKDETICLIDYK